MRSFVGLIVRLFFLFAREQSLIGRTHYDSRLLGLPKEMLGVSEALGTLCVAGGEGTLGMGTVLAVHSGCV